MSIAQIATSVTILNSKIGYNGLSLSNRDNDSAPVIYAGGIIEISNAYFYVSSNETPNGTTWTNITTGNTAYITLTPSGTAGSQIITTEWTDTAPTYIPAKGGWYLSAASNIRYAFSAIKESATEYRFKQKLMGESTSATAGGCIITSVGGTTETVYSSDIIINEPCMVYGVAASTGAGNFYGIPQAKINGTYTLGATANYIVFYDHGNTTFYNICNLNPGVYRFAYLGSASAEGTVTFYRAGRMTDVTQ